MTLDADRPVHLEITAATVNDVVVGPSTDRAGSSLTKPMPIMPGGSVCTRLAAAL
jgi:hypothetical protein